jgi:hypothetical protein
LLTQNVQGLGLVPFHWTIEKPIGRSLTSYWNSVFVFEFNNE